MMTRPAIGEIFFPNETRGFGYELYECLADNDEVAVFKAWCWPDKSKSSVLLRFVSCREAVNTDEIGSLIATSFEMVHWCHPNVTNGCTIYRANDGVCLVRGFIEGQSLASLIEEKNDSLTLNQKLKILMAVADGLTYLHPYAFHGNLKAENVIIRPSGRVLLVDYAPCSYKRKFRRIPYLLPESLRDKFVDAPSDVYSFGMLAYEFLSGARVFESKPYVSPAIAPYLDLPSLVGSNFEYPAWLDQMIHVCTRKNPRRRYQTAQELYDVMAEKLGQPTRYKYEHTLKQYRQDAKTFFYGMRMWWDRWSSLHLPF